MSFNPETEKRGEVNLSPVATFSILGLLAAVLFLNLLPSGSTASKSNFNASKSVVSVSPSGASAEGSNVCHAVVDDLIGYGVNKDRSVAEAAALASVHEQCSNTYETASLCGEYSSGSIECVPGSFSVGTPYVTCKIFTNAIGEKTWRCRALAHCSVGCKERVHPVQYPPSSGATQTTLPN